jgi:hypothetical protein
MWWVYRILLTPQQIFVIMVHLIVHLVREIRFVQSNLLKVDVSSRALHENPKRILKKPAPFENIDCWEVHCRRSYWVSFRTGCYKGSHRYAVKTDVKSTHSTLVGNRCEKYPTYITIRIFPSVGQPMWNIFSTNVKSQSCTNVISYFQLLE